MEKRNRGRGDGKDQLGTRHRALPLVNARLSALPRTLQRIAEYVLENPALVVRQTANELATATNSGPATVVRFCKVVGFDGFKEFKLALAGDLAARCLASAEGNADARANTGLTGELTERIVQAIQETQFVLDQAAVDRLANAMLSARRIDVYGSAVCGLVAQHLAFRLLRIGMPAHAIVDPVYAAYVATGLGPTSVVITVSDSRMVVEALKGAKSAGAFTAAITHRSDGAIAKYADEVVLTAGADYRSKDEKPIVVFTNLIAIEVLVSLLTAKLGNPSSTENLT
ncbi:MurR/RpiR family transcriptional regulator [Bradyrhizobium sp. UFLA01-814]|uniref:MurR/RpiR family transcriptional regulator n=1 Tax=Bradyrhizobium sp. UFLA01-814 TaxID=3023480 RepID=UPI00398B54B3